MPRLLRSKLRPPSVPRFAVDRARLTRRVSEGAAGKLTLISAPAGFGKSVLVAQWAATRATQPAWLTIDERDCSGARLAQHLLAALSPHGLNVDQNALALVPDGGGFGDVLLDVLLEGLHDLDETWIVFEDIDRIGESALADDLARLIRESPPSVHFVVTSRADPNLPLHQLRSRGELTQLRADELRFTTNEAHELIDDLSEGRSLTSDQLAHLVARTEGWPVAVQLAALSLRTIDDVDLFIDRFAEDDRSVADFLSSEFLDRESDDTRRFLIDCSVLEHLHPDLCNAIVERTDGKEMLETLERRGLFITRAPRRATWYRCHRLVREFLRHDLGITEPDRPRTLLVRAADWYVAQGENAQAAACLIDGEAWAELIGLVGANGPTLLDAGDAAVVLEWIDAIPPNVRRTSLPLQLTQAALNMVIGRLSAASAIVHTLEGETALPRGQQLAADMILASLVEGSQPPEEALARAQRVLARDDFEFDASVINIFGFTGISSIECYMGTTAARANLLLGNASAADTYIQRAEAALEGTPPRFQIHALGTRALIDALSGRLITAESAAGRALEFAGLHVAPRHPALITPMLALALVARARNDIDTAAELVDQTCDDAENWRRWPWAGLLRAEQAQLETDRGRPERAVEVIRCFAQTSAPPPSPLVASRLRAAEARALLVLGDREVAQRLVADDPTTRPYAATAAVRLLIAATSDDSGWARKELDGWPDESAPIGVHELALWGAIVDGLEGDNRAATDRIAALITHTEREDHIRLFLDAGSDGIRLVRDVHRAQPRPYTRRILDAAATRPTATTADELVDQLSARELAVLRYLPTRMAYGEIAREMFVSVNTLKTHVRHISQKLGVSGRDAAVARAEELGLL